MHVVFLIGKVSSAAERTIGMRFESTSYDSSFDKNESVSNDTADIIYDVPSLWRSDGLSFVDEIYAELSMLSSKLTEQSSWSLSLSELRMVATEKVEMSTTNAAIKDLYDKAHDIALNRMAKNIDLITRLRLSGIFKTEDHQLQQISVGFIVQRTMTPFTLQNIEILMSTMNSDGLLLLDYSVSKRKSYIILAFILTIESVSMLPVIDKNIYIYKILKLSLIYVLKRLQSS